MNAVAEANVALEVRKEAVASEDEVDAIRAPMDRFPGAATALREHASKVDARSGGGTLDSIFLVKKSRVEFKDTMRRTNDISHKSSSPLDLAKFLNKIYFEDGTIHIAHTETQVGIPASH